jgi:hypothetical protein
MHAPKKRLYISFCFVETGCCVKIDITLFVGTPFLHHRQKPVSLEFIEMGRRKRKEAVNPD